MKRWLMLLALMVPAMAYGEDFTLTIAVPLKDGIRTIRFETKEQEPSFHVVLTNTSGKDLRIWESGNFCGYDNLSFELTDKEGRTWKLERAPRGWYGTFFVYLTMKPNESHVFDVWFPDDWNNHQDAGKKEDPSTCSWFPEDWSSHPFNSKASNEVTLRAVFATSQNMAAEHGVWSGTVRSPEVKVRLQDAR